MQGQGEAPAYRNEGTYGYGYAPPRGYPSPYGYGGSPHYDFAPPTGYQGQGMGPGYGSAPGYGDDNPPVPGYGYDNASAPGGEGYAHPGYQVPHGYAAPYGDPAQNPWQRDPGFDSGAFEAAPMAPPAYPFPPSDYAAPFAQGYEHAPGAGMGMPMDQALHSPASTPAPPVEQFSSAPAPANEPEPASAEAVALPEPAAQDAMPEPEPQAETDEEKQEG